VLIDDWIDVRISEAKKNNPSVTEEPIKRISDLLNGFLCERSLSKKELSEIADNFLSDISALDSSEKTL